MATPTFEESIKEGASEIRDLATIDTPDDELVKIIDKKIQLATKDFEEMRKEGLRNERYWAKDHLAGLDLRWHNSRIVQNRIYFGVETMIPIITSKPAEPVISIANDEEEETEDSRRFTNSLQQILLNKYYDPDYPQQELFEMVARHLLLFKIGIPKIVWYEELDDYVVEFVHPHKIIIGNDGHYNSDVWVAQYMEKTVNDLVKEFPEKKDKLLLKLFPNVAVNMETFGDTPVGFWEYWPEDGSFTVWKMKGVILQKKVNPYINWTDDQKFDKENNHFDYPKKPYMFLNSQTLGRHIWDDTTPVSQAIPLQDGINLMQRIITDSARDQGILVGAMELIDKDELYKYTGGPNEKLAVTGSDPSKALYRVPPKPEPTTVQENLIHLEAALDNVLGTHSTLRGEKSKQPTLGQDVIAKEADTGRIEGIVRGIERTATEVYNWQIQMMVVKYKEEHYQKRLGKKRGEEFYKQFQEAYKKGLKATVKPGSTLPTDKISQRAEAIELIKANKISDKDFFERMDFPNAKKMAQNLWLQENAPEELYPELAEQIEAKKQRDTADAQALMQTQMQTQPQVMPTNGQAGPAMPVGQGMPQVQPQAPIEQPMGQPTEHTEALLAGQQVQPFEGIDPSQAQDHLSRELQFVGSDEFMQLPEEVQAIYAQHVVAEQELLQQQGVTASA